MVGKNISHEYGPIALAIIVAAIIFSAAFYFSPKSSETLDYKLTKISNSENLRLIYASAEASQYVEPDKVDIILSVVSKGEDAAAVQAENDKDTRSAKAVILALGIPEKDIQTAGYSLDRSFNYSEETHSYEPVGYTLTNSIHVTSYDVSLAGTILKAAIASGANQVTSVSYGLTDNARDKAYSQLLTKASWQAKDKASAMAAATGVRIVGLNAMTEGYTLTDVLAGYKNAMAGAGMPAPQDVSVSAGLVKVSATVNAGYEIE